MTLLLFVAVQCLFQLCISFEFFSVALPFVSLLLFLLLPLTAWLLVAAASRLFLGQSALAVVILVLYVTVLCLFEPFHLFFLPFLHYFLVIYLWLFCTSWPAPGPLRHMFLLPGRPFRDLLCEVLSGFSKFEMQLRIEGVKASDFWQDLLFNDNFMIMQM